MRSSTVSVIQSIPEFRFIRALLIFVVTGDSSYISGTYISSPFWCKERFCDSVSFGIIPSSGQTCRAVFSNYFVFSKLKRVKRMDLLSRLFIFSKFTYVVIRNISEISNVVTKETSQLFSVFTSHVIKTKNRNLSMN